MRLTVRDAVTLLCVGLAVLLAAVGASAAAASAHPVRTVRCKHRVRPPVSRQSVTRKLGATRKPRRTVGLGSCGRSVGPATPKPIRGPVAGGAFPVHGPGA